MGEPQLADDHVVDMVDYLRETLAEIDETIADLNRRRVGIATRLAVIATSSDPTIQTAVDDHSERVAAGRPYEDAMDANEFVMEAHRRFVE